MSDLEDVFAFQLKAAKLPVPQREFRFLPPRRWLFDFAWPDLMVAVEVEGGTYVRGRHSRPGGFELDCLKYGAAVIAGWRVLRLTGHMVEDGRGLEMTQRLIASASGLPHP